MTYTKIKKNKSDIILVSNPLSDSSVKVIRKVKFNGLTDRPRDGPRDGPTDQQTNGPTD